MSISKKIMWAGLAAVAGVVLYRFGRIVAHVIQEEFLEKSPRRRAKAD